MARDKPIDALEYELQQDRAFALGRTAAKMEAALEALRAHDAAPVGGRAAREALLIEAGERVWYYVVHREALGFTDHRKALELYGVPPEVAARIGPRPRRSS